MLIVENNYMWMDSIRKMYNTGWKLINNLIADCIGKEYLLISMCQNVSKIFFAWLYRATMKNFDGSKNNELKVFKILFLTLKTNVSCVIT